MTEIRLGQTHATEVKLSADIDCRVVRVSARDLDHLDAVTLLHEPALLVIDGVFWPIPMAEIEGFRERRERKYDDQFHAIGADSPDGLIDVLYPTQVAMLSLMLRLYGHVYNPVRVNSGWRPYISRGEPMHYDSRYEPGQLIITSFLNVSSRPREYGISHTLPRLCREFSNDIRDCCPTYHCPRVMPRELREATRVGRGPFYPGSPRHLIRFATGSVWLFDPKRVSHELRYGECAVALSLVVDVTNPTVLPEVDLSCLRDPS